MLAATDEGRLQLAACSKTLTASRMMDHTPKNCLPKSGFFLEQFPSVAPLCSAPNDYSANYSTLKSSSQRQWDGPAVHAIPTLPVPSVCPTQLQSRTLGGQTRSSSSNLGKVQRTRQAGVASPYKSHCLYCQS